MKAFKDVAHFYSRSGITIVSLRDKERRGRLLSVDQSTMAVAFGDGYPVSGQSIMQCSFEYSKPVLRRISGMTVEEAVEFVRLMDSTLPPDRIFELEFSYSLIYLKSINEQGEDEYYYCSIDFMLPMQLKWLFDHGFDVFGLIDNGEAIEKEVSRG